jgi:8-oxo-dGTP diphosphatase
VVWRPGDAEVEVCLVHRPRYDDWSLPKGKLEPGEHPLVAAVREVAEETDAHAVPQVRLARTHYTTREGVPKTVDYWAMRAVGAGGFQVHTEVDEVRWLPVAAAVGLASYDHDARVLRDFAALPPVTAVLALLGTGAHHAGTPSGRPACGLAPVLALIRPQRLLSATPPQNAAELNPLAELLDVPVEVDAVFEAPLGDAAAARLTALAADGVTAVVCARDGVVSHALARLSGGSPVDYPSGCGWLLAFSGDRLIAADRLSVTDA